MGVGLMRTCGNGGVFHGVYFTLFSVWSCDQEVVYIGPSTFFFKNGGHWEYQVQENLVDLTCAHGLLTIRKSGKLIG